MRAQIILYHTSWCAPCNELIMAGKKNIVNKSYLIDLLEIREINCKLYPNDVKVINVRRYPTIRFYIDGHVYELCGNKTEYEILEFVKQFI